MISPITGKDGLYFDPLTTFPFFIRL
ncbi:hypothetical protein HYN56_16390 [Flavobacterium crocinum]|uniref:Vps72/YL1 C-terminal domain-containing protein n=1 Tax=Flavobacterium crocinum TaxID=2183896 RepID=A0A2S1YTZ0_9FLAO|nr:hypothetical protein HYN56_16390 [Flavobacterium crocinum]